MKKILFLIHDLGPGGAEKVLVNLANHMDPEKFDVTVMTLFDYGVNRSFLKPHVHYRYCFKRMFRGNSHILKLLSPAQLHRWLIKDTYDIEISYLEGPSARVISGCPNPNTKLVSWTHIEMHTQKRAARGFRSYGESARCYSRFHQIVCVSEYVKKDFLGLYPQLSGALVLYNTNETSQIRDKALEPVSEECFQNDAVKLCAVGKLIPVKGVDRLLRIHCRLQREGYNLHTYLLGEGSERDALENYVQENGMENQVTFLGYQTNPYKYVANCDLFVCASFAEGFSTAATEALIVGTPVCTVEVSGMKEMLGENNEYGIVTENDEQALYESIKRLLDDPTLLAHYTRQAALRGKDFDTQNTVQAVERLLEEM